MTVEMKKEIRKRIACMMGTTQEAIRKAVKGKIEPTLFPTEYFVKQKEDNA